MENNKKTYKITRKVSWKDFPPAELVQLQKNLSQRSSLTIAECAIWLGISCGSVSKLIKQGVLVAYRPFAAQAIRIDVEASKPLLKEHKQSNLCASNVHQRGKNHA